MKVSYKTVANSNEYNSPSLFIAGTPTGKPTALHPRSFRNGVNSGVLRQDGTSTRVNDGISSYPAAFKAAVNDGLINGAGKLVPQ